MQYLLIGNGRLARHFRYYLESLNLPFMTWHRGESLDALQRHLQKASHILFLIPDSAIEPFIHTYCRESHARRIHCSGRLVTPWAEGAHPLMTFGMDLYDADFYRHIPFVIEKEAVEFEQLLPGLPNPHCRLDSEKKALYHALCVMAGNFSCMLWQKVCEGFSADLHLPIEMLRPYLHQQVENVLKDPSHALTGPLVRGDQATIEAHLQALQGDPFQSVYNCFVKAYHVLKNKEKTE